MRRERSYRLVTAAIWLVLAAPVAAGTGNHLPAPDAAEVTALLPCLEQLGRRWAAVAGAPGEPGRRARAELALEAELLRGEVERVGGALPGSRGSGTRELGIPGLAAAIDALSRALARSGEGDAGAVALGERLAAALAGLPEGRPAANPRAAASRAAPANDACAAATSIGPGAVAGDTTAATPDGAASCASSSSSRDVWYRLTVPAAETYLFETLGSFMDTVLSVHTGCPGTVANELACNNDSGASGAVVSALVVGAAAGQTLWLRVSDADGFAGAFTLTTTPAPAEILGTVTEEASALPLADADIWLARGSAQTGAGGTYRVSVPPGAYWAEARKPDTHVPEIFEGIDCPICQTAVGDVLELSPGAARANVDFSLVPAGAIAGRVGARETGAGLSGVWVTAREFPPGGYGTAITQADGAYEIRGLRQGMYQVSATVAGRAPQVFEDIQGVAYWRGDMVEVTAGRLTPDVDFGLLGEGRIAGSVKAADGGAPLAAWVSVSGPLGLSLGGAVSSATDGSYQIDGLAPGDYRVSARDLAGDYFYEFWNGALCPPDCDGGGATAVTVASGKTVAGVDFTLERAGTIAGKITGPGGGGAQAWVRAVDLHSAAGDAVFLDLSDGSSGAFAIGGLPTGTFAVYVEPDGAYVPELYDDLACLACDPRTGTPVPVTAGTTTQGVDIALEAGGAIAGRLSRVGSNFDIFGRIEIFDEAGNFIHSDLVGAAYSLGGLLPGAYFVRAESDSFAAQLYDDHACAAGCDETTGTPVTVSGTATTGGVDFALEPCREGASDAGLFNVRISAPVVARACARLQVRSSRPDADFRIEPGAAARLEAPWVELGDVTRVLGELVVVNP